MLAWNLPRISECVWHRETLKLSINHIEGCLIFKEKNHHRIMYHGIPIDNCADDDDNISRTEIVIEFFLLMFFLNAWNRGIRH